MHYSAKWYVFLESRSSNSSWDLLKYESLWTSSEHLWKVRLLFKLLQTCKAALQVCYLLYYSAAPDSNVQVVHHCSLYNWVVLPFTWGLSKRRAVACCHWTSRRDRGIPGTRNAEKVASSILIHPRVNAEFLSKSSLNVPLWFPLGPLTALASTS